MGVKEYKKCKWVIEASEHELESLLLFLSERGINEIEFKRLDT